MTTPPGPFESKKRSFRREGCEFKCGLGRESLRERSYHYAPGYLESSSKRDKKYLDAGILRSQVHRLQLLGVDDTEYIADVVLGVD